MSAIAVTAALNVGSASAGKPEPVSGVDCAVLLENPERACNPELVELCAAIDESTSLKTRDRDTMVSKVIGAGIKIDQDKWGDAEGKLGEIEAKLYQLLNAAKPKISEIDAEIIGGALIPAETCVVVNTPTD